MIDMLNGSMPQNLGICRIHVAGDFFSPAYMFAWINMAMMHTDRLFYAYTKSLKYWLKYREYVDLLDNFVLTASYGGRDDDMIEEHNLRSTKVVFSEVSYRPRRFPCGTSVHKRSRFCPSDSRHTTKGNGSIGSIESIERQRKL